MACADSFVSAGILPNLGRAAFSYIDPLEPVRIGGFFMPFPCVFHGVLPPAPVGRPGAGAPVCWIAAQCYERAAEGARVTVAPIRAGEKNYLPCPLAAPPFG